MITNQKTPGGVTAQVRDRRLTFKKKALFSVFTLAVLLTFFEVLVRYSVPILPLRALVYLHTDIKDSNPRIMELIKEAYPGLYEFKELSNENWTLMPNREQSGKDEEGIIFSLGLTDSNGFLSPDHPAATDKQLLVLGDSCVAARSQKPIPWLLKEYTKTPIYTMASPAWGPSNYRDAFNSFGKNRNAKTVLIFTYENDINDSWLHQMWKKTDTKLSFLRFHASRFWLPGTASGERTNTGAFWVDKHSYFWNLIKNVLNDAQLIRPAQADGDGSETFNGRNGDFKMRMDSWTMYFQKSGADFMIGQPEYYWVSPYFEQILLLKAAIEEAKMKPVFVWIPARERIYLPLLSPERRKVYSSRFQTEKDFGYDLALSEFSKKNNVLWIDTTPDLSRLAKAGEKLYYSNDFHPNVKGQRAIVESAWNGLRRLGVSF